jgi:hypothetical protein
MGGELLCFYKERGIQREPTPGYSPECNGLAKRHNLTLLDMARPMLADSGNERLGLAPLGKRFAGNVILYANDLHNATPASGALFGCTPFKGCLGRGVTLGAFRRFGCGSINQGSRSCIARSLRNELSRGASWDLNVPLAPVCTRCSFTTVVSLSLRKWCLTTHLLCRRLHFFLRRERSSSYCGHRNLKNPGSQRLGHPCQQLYGTKKMTVMMRMLEHYTFMQRHIHITACR